MNREANLVRRGDKAARDLKEYLEFVIRIKPAAHQQEWLEACQDIGNKASGQRYCIIAPPGAGKSVFIGVGFVSWIIGMNPELHYGLLSYADQVAWDRAKPIRDVIEKSSPFNYAFPDTVPDLSSWDRRGFRVQREDLADPHPTLRAGGISSAVVSYRLNGLVLDDVLDVKTAATAKTRKRAYDDYVNAISTRMVKNAWQLCIGTRWSDDDFIGELLRLKHHGAPVWTAIHVPAILPNGKSYWPEQYSLDEGEDSLMEKKTNFPQLFAIQYQGDTTGGEAQMITKIATYDKYKKDQNGRPHAEWVKEKDLLMGASWDTALKDGQENDYSVMYIGGLDKHGNIWVIDREKDRFTISEIVRLSKKAYMDWQTYNIWFEDSAVGTPAVTTIREEMPQVPCLEVSTPVLTRDLRWVPAGSLREGDHIIGFNEEPSNGYAGQRNLADAVILCTSQEDIGGYVITLDNGEELPCTGEHRFLTKTGGRMAATWQRVDDMYKKLRGNRGTTYSLMQYFNTWEQSSGRDAGYLAGAFDADGCLTLGDGLSGALHFKQYDNDALAHVKKCLDALEFKWSVTSTKTSKGVPIYDIRVLGGLSETARFLGVTRPPRLLAKWAELKLGIRRFRAIGTQHIVSIKKSKMRVARLKSSSKTYISAGYGSHNCDTVYYGGGKMSRANVLAQYIHNGQVRFPSMAPWFPDMEYYLKHFPFVDHDDDIDSLFILVDNLLQMQHPAGYADRPRAVLDMR